MTHYLFLNFFHKKKNRGITIIFTILLLLFVSEGLMRLTYKEKFDKYLPSPLNYQPDSITGYRYEPNSTFSVAGDTVRVNSHGYLGKDFSIEKDSGVFRIVMVGSCELSGVVNFQFYSNPCIYLQELFDQEGWNVEVINLGVDGALRSFELYKTVGCEAVKYNPDLIISESFIPFFSIFHVRERYRDYTIQYSYGCERLRNEAIKRIDEQYSFKKKVIFFLYDHSYLLKSIHAYFNHKGYNIRLLNDIYIHYDRRYIVKVSRPQFWTLDKSLEMLKSTNMMLEENGTELVLFSFILNPELKEQLENTCNYLYLSEPNEWIKEYEYFDSQHFSDAGNKFLAKCFFNKLVDQKYIPVKYKK